MAAGILIWSGTVFLSTFLKKDVSTLTNHNLTSVVCVHVEQLSEVIIVLHLATFLCTLYFVLVGKCLSLSLSRRASLHVVVLISIGNHTVSSSIWN